MFESLVELISGSAWTYAIVVGMAAADAVAPIVPSETLVVAAAALGASGRLSVPLVFVAAAAGAAVGDNVAYAIGRLGGGPARRFMSRSAKRHARLSWVERQLDERGATFVLIARFIPGGRTVTMLAAGLVNMRWRRFAPIDVAAALLWSLYACLIGVVGGTALEEEPLAGVAVALGIAFVLSVAMEIVRRIRVRRRRR